MNVDEHAGLGSRNSSHKGRKMYNKKEGNGRRNSFKKKKKKKKDICETAFCKGKLMLLKGENNLKNVQ